MKTLQRLTIAWIWVRIFGFAEGLRQPSFCLDAHAINDVSHQLPTSSSSREVSGALWIPRDDIERVAVLSVRGGADSDYDFSDQEESEEEEDFYDDDEEDRSTSRVPPSTATSSTRNRGRPPRHGGPGPPSNRKNSNYDHRMARPPASDRNRRPPPSTAKKTADWAKSVASKSLKFSGQAAWKTVSMPGKVGYHLIRPKHVDEREIGGLWRLDQQITERNDRIVASVATIEIDPRKHVVIVRPVDGPPLIQPYKFSKTKLGSFKLEFVAKTFMVGSQTRMYGYKGTWQRKLADPKVLKLAGKIYQLRKNRLSKGFTLGNPIGTFVARRRVQLDDEDFDEDDDEEYDDAFEDEDEDEEYEQGYGNEDSYDEGDDF